MSETKLAMSRALGAAFLNHQVEQLEKSVSNSAASGNWRDRRYTPSSNGHTLAAGGKKPPSSPKGANNRKKATDNGLVEREIPKTVVDGNRRRSGEESDKDGDIVVVDASVLVHSLNHLKKWSRNGRSEIVIVPLEALNTLDLLKKGSHSLAQRARAASRVLEAQVGTNPRIRVQRDDAFVLWDDIEFSDKSSDTQNGSQVSPEWVRRTICCARWEADKAKETLPSIATPKVVIATCDPSTTSPQISLLKLAHGDSELSPVPGPAPSHMNKHEPRTAGAQVAHWAAKAGIDILKVDATPLQSSPGGHGRSSSEEERPKRTPNKGPPRRSGGPRDSDKLRGGLVERSPAVLAMMEMVKRPDSKAVRVLARGEKLDP